MKTDEDACPACHGTGQYVTMKPIRPYAWIEPPPECRTCGGTGKKPKLVPDVPA
jgi:DnaJ-class molecular chaperone